MRILLVVSRHPWPPRRGDQMRAHQFLAALAGEHQVTLLAPEPPAAAAAGAAASASAGAASAAPPPADLPPFRYETYRVRRGAVASGLARSAVAGLPFQAALFHQPHLGRRLRELAPAADLVVLQLVRLAGSAGDLGTTPFVVDLIDSLSLNLERRARFDRPWLRPLLRWESRRLLAAESRLLAAARAGLLVSERDRAWLGERLPAAAAARLAVVPLAVPGAMAETASGTAPGTASGADGGPAAGTETTPPPRLVFTGNLGYFVNADAVEWWIRDVWPAVRAARPEVELVVAGARPARRVRRVAAAPGVRLIDTPPDLGAVLREAAVSLAPLRAGSGMPVKVLEAWAAGVPVAASPWAAAGAAGRPGRDLLVAGTVEEWRDAVLRLLDDAALRHRLAAAGRERLATGHTPEAVRSAWSAALAR